MSVVIPTWRRACWLQRCLLALECQARTPDEVIVVGRAEDSEAQGVVVDAARRNVRPIRWVEVDRPGHVAPVRRGAHEADGDIVAFLDDDTEPEARWLGAITGPFAQPGVACAGGRVLTSGVRAIVKRDAGQVRWYGQHIGNVGSIDAPGPIDVAGVMEGNWAWRKSVLFSLEWDPVLEFDDASMYGLDLCLQARAAGWRIVYEPAARVIHHAAPRDPMLDRAHRPRRTFTYARNYTYIGLKRFRGTRRAAFVVWWWLVGERGAYGFLTGLADLAIGRDGVWEQIGAAWQGRAAGMRLWLSRTG